MSQDQYEYPNQEDKQEFSNGPMSGMDSIRSILKNKRMMMSFGMVIAIYLATHLLAWVLGKEKQDQASQQAVVEAMKEKPDPQSQAANPVDQHAAALAQKNDQLDTRLVDLKHHVEASQNQYQALEQRLQEQSQQYQALIHHLHDFDTTLAGLKGQMVDQNRRLFAIEKRLAPKKKRVRAKKVVLKHYHLRAVIYGRAWLADHQGHTRTVRVGDRVPTYGAIKSIHAKTGVVSTTSGRLITFDSRDD